MKYIEAESLGEAWIKAMNLVINSGEYINDEDVMLKEN